MSRTYQYVLSDPPNSTITITTSDSVVGIDQVLHGSVYGYAIESISGTFDGKTITGLYGEGGELQSSAGIGLWDNMIFEGEGQGAGGNVYGIDGYGIVFQTTSGVYHLTSFNDVISYSVGRDGGTVSVDTYIHPETDTTPPTFDFSFPFDNATGVDPQSDIQIIFSELIKAGHGTITISDGAGDVRVIDVTDASQVTVDGSIVYVNPTLDLKLGTIYHVSVSPGAVTDLHDNVFAGIENAFDFQTRSTISGDGFLLDGTGGDDSMAGTATDPAHYQILHGLAGNDTIYLGSAGGFAYGDQGDDSLYGGDSSTAGPATVNVLIDDEGANVLHGGSASNGGTLQNFMNSVATHVTAVLGNADGAGSEVLNVVNAGNGLNEITGGTATNGAAIRNYINGGSGIDRVSLGGANGVGSSEFSLLNIGDGNNEVTFGVALNGATTQNYFNGGSGDDQAFAGGAEGAGASAFNQIVAGDGTNSSVGGSASLGGTVHNDLAGGNGFDYMNGGSAFFDGSFVFNLIQGREGNGSIVGGNAGFGGHVQNRIFAGQAQAHGGDSSDGGSLVENEIYGTGLIHGGNASSGGEVRNVLTGSLLYAGQADTWSYVENTLTGTGGADLFVFESGKATTTITNFQSGNGAVHDRISIAGYGMDDLADVLARATEIGGSSHINLIGAGGSQNIVLEHVTMASLTTDNFIFA